MHGHWVFCKVDTLIGFEAIGQPFDNHLVEIVAAQVGIAVGRKHFEHATAEFEDGNIECSAAKVEHGNLHVLVSFVNTIGKCGSCRLVNDTLHVKSCNLSSFFRCLTLRVGEVSGHGDNSIGHFLSEIVFGGLLHLLKDHGRYFLRCVFTPFYFYTRQAVFVHHSVRHALCFLTTLLVCLTHEALNRVNGVLGVGDCLSFGGVAHLSFAIFNKAHHRRRGAFALAVGDYHWLVAFENGNAAVSCS